MYPSMKDTAWETSSTRQLLSFSYSHISSQRRVILLSSLFMAGATLLSITIPALAEEIVLYGTEKASMTIEGSEYGAGNSTVAALEAATLTAPGKAFVETPEVGEARFSFLGLGVLSERLFKPLLPVCFAALRGWSDVARNGSGTESVAVLYPYAEGVLCRCLLMAVTIIGYHIASLLAHLLAYYAGTGAQNSLMQDSVRRILHTPHPDRVAVVNAVKLAQLITSSGRALNDASLFFFQGMSLHRQGSHVTTEETSVQAYIANILQRCETVFVFRCNDFVLDRTAERLGQVRRLTDALNRSIHGYAAISSGLTRLILVVALGLSSYYQRKGKLSMRHTILYFACFQSFVNTLTSLSSAVGELRAALGRLKTLEAMLRWYSEPMAITPGDDGAAASESVVIDVQDSVTATVALDDVSFSYPAVPAFFSEVGLPAGSGDAVATLKRQTGAVAGGQRNNGLSRVSFTAAVGGITVLFGPSGCGKSTCLRLLCGLVRPHSGAVRTQRRAVLLEQQHAVFIGTVAENILLTNLSGFGGCTSRAEAAGSETPLSKKNESTDTAPTFAELQRRVMEASVKSGCASFLSDPFGTFIESADHPPFSGGQLQRIALARIFAQTDGYSLVLLDEPTTGLDGAAVKVLLDTFRELRDTYHKTVLISTHDHRVSEVADKVIDLSASVAKAR